MTSTGSADTARGKGRYRASMTVRYLWLVFALLVGGVPPVGAVGWTTVPGQQIRTRVVLGWTLRIVVIPVVLAATRLNELLKGARWAADRATGDLTRWPVADITAAFPGPVTIRPVPQPGPNGPRHQTPNLAPGTGSGPTTSSNDRPGRQTLNPRSTRPADHEDHLRRHLSTQSATFSGRSS
jgi:hypothetical protein